VNNPRELVIIGNAPPAGDLSAQVDRADVVIRFNACRHFATGMTGNRTTVLVLRGALEVGDRFGADPAAIPVAVSGTLREVWFLYGTAAQQSRIMHTHGLQGRTARIVDPGFVETVGREMELPGDKMPSAGMIAIALALLNPDYGGHRVGIAGFGWKGWHGHDWERERNFCESLARWGQLRILDRSSQAQPAVPVRCGDRIPQDGDGLTVDVWRLCDGVRDLETLCREVPAAQSKRRPVRRWQVRKSWIGCWRADHIAVADAGS
jgi:hypothetical protein